MNKINFSNDNVQAMLRNSKFLEDIKNENMQVKQQPEVDKIEPKIEAEKILSQIAYSNNREIKASFTDAVRTTKEIEERKVTLSKLSEYNVNFEVDDITSQVVVKITDTEGKVVRQAPPEVMVEIARTMKEYAKSLEKDYIDTAMATYSKDKMLDLDAPKGSIVDEYV